MIPPSLSPPEIETHEHVYLMRPEAAFKLLLQCCTRVSPRRPFCTRVSPRPAFPIPDFPRLFSDLVSQPWSGRSFPSNRRRRSNNLNDPLSIQRFLHIPRCSGVLFVLLLEGLHLQVRICALKGTASCESFFKRGF